MADPIADLFYGLGDSLLRYGTVTRRTTQAEDTPETFSRASPAQARGKEMRVVEADTNVLRTEWEDLDGDGVYETPLTILEGQDTNRQVHSEKLSETIVINASVLDDVTEAPDGYQTMDALVEDTTPTTNHYLYRNLVPPGAGNGESWFFTIFGKPTDNRYKIRLGINSGDLLAGYRVTFNLRDGTFENAVKVGTGYDLIPDTIMARRFGESWRVGFGVTNTAHTTVRTQVEMIGPNDSEFYDGDGTSRVFLWGWDINSHGGTYIPTTRYLIQPDDRGLWGLELPGTSGNFAQTPDAAPLKITGDLSVVVRARLAQWSGGLGERALVSKFNTQQAYRLVVDTATGILNLYHSQNGTTSEGVKSTVGVGLADDAEQWVKATRAASTGQVLFYLGGTGETPTWTQLGDPVAGTAGAIFNSTDAVELGSSNGGASMNVQGFIYRPQLYSGIEGAGGTLVLDADYTDPDQRQPDRVKLIEKANNAVVEAVSTSSQVTRAPDMLSVPYLEAQEAMTFYFAFQEVGTLRMENRGVFQAGSTDGTGARFVAYRGSGATPYYRFAIHNGTESVETDLSTAAKPVPGQLVELLCQVTPGRQPIIQQAIDGGAVETGTAAGSLTYFERFAAAELLIGRYSDTTQGFYRFRSGKAKTGQHSMDVMRIL